MKRLAVLLLSLALCLTSVPAAKAHYHYDIDPTGGGTVVTVEGTTVGITVGLDVIMPASCEEIGIPQSWFDMVNGGFAAAASYWNQALADRAAACFEIELSVVVNFIDGNDSADGGGPNVFIHRWFYPAFESPQLTTETTNDDTAEVFTTNGTAYLPPWMFEPPARNLAHELGHMLGLGDDFAPDAEGIQVDLPGREGTLMDAGDLVDQALVDRLGNLVERSGAPVPGCNWTGDYAGTVTWDCGPLGERSGTLEGEFTIVVDAEGTATMDITHTVTGSCAGPGGSLTTPITATGERTPSGFQFPAFFGGTGTVTITVSGDQGTGTFMGPVPGPATVDVTFEVMRS